MAFGTVFKNFGHAIATGAKYIAIGVTDIVKIANKAQAIAPEVELLVGALAGPVGTKATDLAFHLLGDVANALETVGGDAAAVAATNGLNVKLDLQTINDLKALIPALKGILAAVGAQVPAAK